MCGFTTLAVAPGQYQGGKGSDLSVSLVVPYPSPLQCPLQGIALPTSYSSAAQQSGLHTTGIIAVHI